MAKYTASSVKQTLNNKQNSWSADDITKKLEKSREPKRRQIEKLNIRKEIVRNPISTTPLVKLPSLNSTKTPTVTSGGNDYNQKVNSTTNTAPIVSEPVKTETENLPYLSANDIYKSRNDRMAQRTEEYKSGKLADLRSMQKEYQAKYDAGQLSEQEQNEYLANIGSLENELSKEVNTQKSKLISNPQDKEEVMRVVSIWNRPNRKMTKEEKAQAKELFGSIYSGANRDLGIDKVAENTGYTPEELLAINRAFDKQNPLQSVALGLSNEAAMKLALRDDEQFQQMKADASVQNPLAYTAGSFAGTAADYSLGNKLMGATSLGAKMASSKLGETGANLITGQALDTLLDTAPETYMNFKNGKYTNSDGSINYRQMGLDIAINQGFNALFNILAESPSIAKKVWGKISKSATGNDPMASARKATEGQEEFQQEMFKRNEEATEQFRKELEKQTGNADDFDDPFADLAKQMEEQNAEPSMEDLEKQFTTPDEPPVKPIEEPPVNAEPIPTPEPEVGAPKPNTQFTTFDTVVKKYAEQLEENGIDTTTVRTAIDDAFAKASSGQKLTDEEWQTLMNAVKKFDDDLRSTLEGSSRLVVDEEAVKAARKAMQDNYKALTKPVRNKAVYVDKEILNAMGLGTKKKLDNFNKWFGIELTKDATAQNGIAAQAYLSNLPDELKQMLGLTGDIPSDMKKVGDYAQEAFTKTKSKKAKYEDFGQTKYIPFEDDAKEIRQEIFSAFDEIVEKERQIANAEPEKVMFEDAGLGNSAEEPIEPLTKDTTYDYRDSRFDEPEELNLDENVSRFADNTARNAGVESEEVIQRRIDEGDYNYLVNHEEDSVREAAQRLREDYEGEYEKYVNGTDLSRNSDGVDADTMMLMYHDMGRRMREALANGDDVLADSISADMRKLSMNIRKKATKYGQFNQAFAKYTRTADDAILQVEKKALDLAKEVGEENPVFENEVKDVVQKFKQEYDRMVSDDLWKSLEQASEEGDDPLQEEVANLIKKALDGHKNVKKKMPLEGIDKIAKQIAEETRRNGKMSDDALDLLEQFGLTGYSGIDSPTVEKIFELYEEANKYGVNSKQRVQIEKEMYATLANTLHVSGTFKEKIDAWRYFAMLFNTKTHARNMVGNKLFGTVTNIKDDIAAALEIAFIRDPAKRTTSFIDKTGAFSKSDKALYTASKEYADEVNRLLVDGNKYYGPAQAIDAEIKVFNEVRQGGTTADAIKNKVGKALNKLTEFNTNALNIEDEKALYTKFADSLTRYLKANGADESIFKATDEASIALLDRATAHAIEQAKIATFHQVSETAKALQNIANNPNSAGTKALGLAMDALVPFKKTPINILKNTLSYSPLNFGKVIASDLPKLRKGLIGASDIIDDVAKGMTGTGLLLTGLALGNAGIITGSGNPDKQTLDKLRGKQNFAINIGGRSYTIENFAPASLPLLVGASLSQDYKGDNAFENVANALLNMANPIVDTTMLKGISDILSTASQYDSGSEVLQAVGAKMVTNYISQFMPTESGNLARTVDDTRRSSYTGKKGIVNTFEMAANQTKNSVPALSKTSEPSIDEWGEEVKNVGGNAGGRFAYNHLLGLGNYAKDTTTEGEAYLDNLYDETLSKTVIPKKQKTEFNYTIKTGKDADGNDITERGSIKVTPEQRTVLDRESGQAKKKFIDILSKNPTVKKLSPEVQQKIVEDLYDFGNEVGKAAVVGNNYVYSDKNKINLYNSSSKALVDYVVANNTISSLGAKPTDATREVFGELGADGIKEYVSIRKEADTDKNNSITNKEMLLCLKRRDYSNADRGWWLVQQNQVPMESTANGKKVPSVYASYVERGDYESVWRLFNEKNSK